MFCRNCGKQLKDGAAFCTNCGTRITPAGQSNAGAAQRPVQPVGPYENKFDEQQGRQKKSLQVPILIMAVLIVAVIGCLVAVLVIRGHRTDEDVTDQTIVFDEEDSDAEADDEEKEAADEEREKADEAQEAAAEPEESAPQEISAEAAAVEEISLYILPNSDSAYLSREDLEGLSKEECRLARNELYARHGRKFDDEGLQNYFGQKDWYTGYIDPADFSDSMLNDFEIANRDLIVRYEEEMGYR